MGQLKNEARFIPSSFLLYPYLFCLSPHFGGAFLQPGAHSGQVGVENKAVAGSG